MQHPHENAPPSHLSNLPKENPGRLMRDAPIRKTARVDRFQEAIRYPERENDFDYLTMRHWSS
jgi:hypothetical protein